MVLKLNTEDFIKKAKEIHEIEYDYSKVEYVNIINKVIIICKEHGDFTQTPHSHLKNHGCKKCGIKNRNINHSSNTEKFIIKAKILHNNFYNYSKTIYKNYNEKVIIICKEHGEFLQKPKEHLNNHGCKKCDIQKKYNEQFIKKCIEKHGNLYDYTNSKYINSNTKIKIICKEHGEFKQKPAKHIQNGGCKKCGVLKSSKKKSSNTNDFIIKSKTIHNEIYDYSKVNYINNRVKVIIICNKHGVFNQTPADHLNGSGCPKCYSNYSKVQIQWLEFLEKYYNINIKHAMNGGEFRIPNTRYSSDGYCKETNTIYEFHGDYYHGNPKIFKPEEINKLCKTTQGELYQKTLEKEQKIKELGFNLIVIWELDWYKINKSIKILQTKFKKIYDNVLISL
jgi:hypothetical protein